MNDIFSVLLKILYFLLVFGIIVLLAYFTTRVIGKRVSVNSGKYMRVVDTLYVGADRTIIIVRVKNEYLLMSSSAKGVEMLKKLDGFEESPSDSEGAFEGYLKNYGERKRGISGLFQLIHKPRSGRDDIDEE